MNKNYILIFLGSISAFIGGWFFLHERDYASTDPSCYRGPCLAESLQWVGISQLLAGISIVLIALSIKDN